MGRFGPSKAEGLVSWHGLLLQARVPTIIRLTVAAFLDMLLKRLANRQSKYEVVL